MEDESTERIVRKIEDLKTELEMEYHNNKERFGSGMMFTALLAGATLVMSGLSGMAEFRVVESRDIVLVIGGSAMPVILGLKWWWVDRHEEGPKEVS